MTITISTILNSIWLKITTILSSIWGWLQGIIMFLIAYLFEIKGMFIVLALIIIFDFIFGLWASIKLKRDITSDKMRSTVIKTFIYLVVMSLSYAIETEIGWTDGISVKILFAIASCVEIYSLLANALIIHPTSPFLKLFKIIVSGEIAKKLLITKDEVDQILEKEKKKKRTSK